MRPVTHDGPLEVGEVYEVPTIDGRPVIDSPHDDSDHFGCHGEHYHIDSRFEDDSEYKAMLASGGPLQMGTFVCRRPYPQKWGSGDFHTKNNAAAITFLLTLDYSNRRTMCGKCPHKGMPVVDGVCSGHRLEWLPDGTAKHRGPFKIFIPEIEAEVPVEKSDDLYPLRIPVTNHPYWRSESDLFYFTLTFQLIDCDGNEVAQHTMKVNRQSVEDFLEDCPENGWDTLQYEFPLMSRKRGGCGAV